MPCGDGGVPYPPTREQELDDKVPIPALCAVLRTMPPGAYLHMLDRIDWKEAGITRHEFVQWWMMHQKRDKKRKLEERRLSVQERIKQNALAKLDPAERAALGYGKEK